MKKQMYVGLGILIFMLGIAGIFLLIPQNADTESEPVLGEATKKLLKEGVKQTVAKSPPPGETEVSGYWHGDHWHRTDHMPQTDGPTNVQAYLPEDVPDRLIEQTSEKLTLDELKELKAQIDSISARVQEKYPEQDLRSFEDY